MDKKISEVLTRNVEEIIVRENLEKKLKSGKKLRIKLGIDPTGSKLHLGRAIPLWKLREFQDLGHQIVLIIGDFTGMLGDPSDKAAERQQLTSQQVKANMKTYLKQISGILDINKTEVHHNSLWLAKLKFNEIVELASLFTVSQMIERENFALRLKSNKPVGLHELLYPLMQGYDSVMVKADIEVGGSDQLFNLLAGRTVQKNFKQNPQDIMTFGIIEGTDGRKMSTSWNNCIYITDEAVEMYGKIMTIKDELIPAYFRDTTSIPLDVVKQIEIDMSTGDNPRDSKAFLARTIVVRYWGDKAALEAEKQWNKQFREHKLPAQIAEFIVDPENADLINVVSNAFNISKSEARRLAEQGGIKISGEIINDADIIVDTNSIIQIGKRRYIKIIYK